MDTENSFYTGIIDSLSKLMNDKHLTQAAMSDYADTTPSQFSKILKGTVYLSIAQISKIAHSLSMSEIDVMTYPKKYISLEKQEQEPVEAILQIKLKKDRKDQVLKLIFGEHNLEILNK